MTRLNNIQVDDLYQAWYPDSSQIAFTSTRGYNYEIHMMIADGSGVTRLNNNLAAESYQTWSLPDVILSNDPWFGAPWCMRDTDGCES